MAVEISARCEWQISAYPWKKCLELSHYHKGHKYFGAVTRLVKMDLRDCLYWLDM